MEKLLHYCWKHRLFPLEELRTTDGRVVEVIDTGLHNRDAGPDFFNAKVRVDGVLWVGNVEIHDRSSDWYAHGHQHDAAYDNVVLHVAEVVDAEVLTRDGRPLPQLQLGVPEAIRRQYDELVTTDDYPPCYRIIPKLSRLSVHAWMSALQVERLEQKTADIARRAEQANGSWETAYFATLARSFGFGINGDAFEMWAQHVPLQAVAHHRDDLFHVEAIFFGQAGLLETARQREGKKPRPSGNAAATNAEKTGGQAADDYFLRLQAEYRYLAHKFSLQPMDSHIWRFLRLRPQNFPYIRIAQLAQLYYNRQAGLSQMLECKTIKELQGLFRTSATPYWQTHYTFGHESAKSEKRLSANALCLVILNTAIPMLFAYGRHHSREDLCDRAFSLLEQLKPEDNHMIKTWRQCGLEVASAGDTQALIQLKKEYCDRKDCLRCRFGYEYLKDWKAASATTLEGRGAKEE